MKAVEIICRVSVPMVMLSVLLYVSTAHWFYRF
jgi:hypothetical protein